MCEELLLSLHSAISLQSDIYGETFHLLYLSHLKLPNWTESKENLFSRSCLAHYKDPVRLKAKCSSIFEVILSCFIARTVLVTIQPVFNLIYSSLWMCVK